MFEYVCDHLIPGCTHRETGDTAEAVRDKAIIHLHEGHDLDRIDNDLSIRLNTVIVPLR